MDLVCNTIKTLRKNKKLTQEAISKKIGISRAWYNKIEQNEVDLKMETLTKLATIFNVSLNDILSGNGNQVNKKLEVATISNNSISYQEIIKIKDAIIKEKTQHIQNLQELLKIKKIKMRSTNKF